MCLGIPGKLVERHSSAEGLAWGTVDFDGARQEVCLACVPAAHIGDYVNVHAGLAISVIDEEEAHRVFEMITQMEPEALDEVRR